MPAKSQGPWYRKGRGYFASIQYRQVNLHTHDAAEAQRLWHKLMAGEPEEPGGVTLDQVFDEYLDSLRPGSSHRRSTTWRLNQMSKIMGDQPAASLTHAKLREFLQSREWGPNMQANFLVALKGALRYCSRKGGVLPENPLPQIKVPARVSNARAAEPEQIAALLLASFPALRMTLWALASTGARPSEIRRSQPEHCDKDGTAIRLPTGKQGKWRVMYLPPSCRPILKRQRESAGEWLFPNERGGQWSEWELPKAVQEAREKAGLPDWITAYTTRHTWITQRLREGVPIATVAKMAGTSVMVINSTYGHLADEDLRAVADGMG